MITSSSSSSHHLSPFFYPPFNNVFQNADPLQDVTNPIGPISFLLHAGYSSSS